MDLVNIVDKILALGVIASQIFIVLAIVYILLPFKNKYVSGFFSKNGLALSFIVALVATSGSLFYSTCAGFVPCPLCWFQRIFMYPEVILLGMALYKRDEKIIDYSLALALIGFAISAYHNYIVVQGLNSVVCTSAESCTTPYVLEFGYITIPMMALTAFILINLLLVFKKYSKKLLHDSKN